MNVRRAQVEWYDGLGNYPVLELLVDEIPPPDVFRYQHDAERGLWFAVHDGYARYYSWSGPENEGGFAGAEFEILTVDGESVVLRGPWSSRSGVINRFFTPHVVDVNITDRESVIEQGYTWVGGSVTYNTALKAVALCETNIGLQCVDCGDDVIYVPYDDAHPLKERFEKTESGWVRLGA